MGGQPEGIANVLKAGHREDLTLAEALALGVKALSSVGGENGNPRQMTATQLEVAVLERGRPGRAFRRITGAALTALLPVPEAAAAAEPKPADAKPADKPEAKPDTKPDAKPEG
jgi:proteasome alpha subunit